MKVIIAGSRDFTDYLTMSDTLALIEIPITEVVCGMARGADMLGFRWANERGIPIKEFPANWDLHGRSAGYKRNEVMANYSDALVAFWDGESRGTKHMIDIATREGLKVWVVRYEAE
jgi:YspA, cpYpsA-related SLOG family